MSDNLHTLLGPYALDAVTSEEHEAFEQHLHTCAACREELEGLQETAARLGVAVAAPPSAELRTRIMDAITRTPQERPLPPVAPCRLAAARCSRRPIRRPALQKGRHALPTRGHY